MPHYEEDFLSYLFDTNVTKHDKNHNNSAFKNLYLTEPFL